MEQGGQFQNQEKVAAEEASEKETKNLMTYKGYLIDLDGTILQGQGADPCWEAFVRELQERQIPYLFVTNNTTRTPEMVRKCWQASSISKRHWIPSIQHTSNH